MRKTYTEITEDTEFTEKRKGRVERIEGNDLSSGAAIVDGLEFG
jgi:hypothetical protein